MEHLNEVHSPLSCFQSTQMNVKPIFKTFQKSNMPVSHHPDPHENQLRHSQQETENLKMRQMV